MRKRTLAVQICFLFLLSLALLPQIHADVPLGMGSFTALSLYNYNLGSGGQRQLVYYEGYWFWFYENSSTTDLIFRTFNEDSGTVSSETLVFNITSGTGAGSYDFSVWQELSNRSYVHIAFYQGVANRPLQYRKGQLQNDGTISWLTTWQQVQAAAATRWFENPRIVTDANGYPYITYHGIAPSTLNITKSSTKNGTWTTAAGFPKTAVSSLDARLNPVVLSNGKIMLVWFDTSGIANYYRVLNSSGWENAATTFGSEAPAAWNPMYYNVLALNNEVFVIFVRESPDQVIAYYYSDGAWDSGTILKMSSATFKPETLTTSIDIDNGRLLVFVYDTDGIATATPYVIKYDGNWHSAEAFGSSGVEMGYDQAFWISPYSWKDQRIAVIGTNITDNKAYITFLNGYLDSNIEDTNTNLQTEGDPYLTQFEGILKSESWTANDNKLTFTLYSPSSTTTTSKINCANKGKPDVIQPAGADGGYDTVTQIQTITWTHSSDQEFQISWKAAGTGEYNVRITVSVNYAPTWKATISINGENKTTDLFGSTTWTLPYGDYVIWAYYQGKNQSQAVSINQDRTLGFNFTAPILPPPPDNTRNILIVAVIVVAAIMFLTFIKRRR